MIRSKETIERYTLANSSLAELLIEVRSLILDKADYLVLKLELVDEKIVIELSEID